MTENKTPPDGLIERLIEVQGILIERNHELFLAREQLAALESDHRAMREALDVIANGRTSAVVGAPDPMQATSPLQFRSEMWGWSQQVARSVLAGLKVRVKGE